MQIQNQLQSAKAIENEGFAKPCKAVQMPSFYFSSRRRVSDARFPHSIQSAFPFPFTKHIIYLRAENAYVLPICYGANGHQCTSRQVLIPDLTDKVRLLFRHSVARGYRHPELH